MSTLFFTRRTLNGLESESDSDDLRNQKAANKITRDGLKKGEKYSQEELAAFESQIKKDFSRHKKIMRPTIPELQFYKCFCRKRYRVYMNQHTKAAEKVENNFDFFKIIQMLRQHSI